MCNPKKSKGRHIWKIQIVLQWRAAIRPLVAECTRSRRLEPQMTKKLRQNFFCSKLRGEFMKLDVDRHRSWQKRLLVFLSSCKIKLARLFLDTCSPKCNVILKKSFFFYIGHLLCIDSISAITKITSVDFNPNIIIRVRVLKLYCFWTIIDNFEKHWRKYGAPSGLT